MKTVQMSLLFLSLVACAPRQVLTEGQDRGEGYVTYAATRSQVISAIIEIGSNIRPVVNSSAFSPVVVSEGNVVLTAKGINYAAIATWSANEVTRGQTTVSLNMTHDAILSIGIDLPGASREWFNRLDQRFARVR